MARRGNRFDVMPHTLREIAKHIDAELFSDNPESEITGVAALQDAMEGELSFLANRRYCRYLKSTKASAVVLLLEDRQDCPVDTLVSTDPYLSYVKAVRYLYQGVSISPGIDERAVVCASAIISSSAHVAATAYIDSDVRIDDNVYIGPGCVINNNAQIARDTVLVANVSICADVQIGERVLLHPGVVIGADGFGIANDAGQWLKLPQLGSVQIGNDVEIGANSTIDRGAINDTIIEEGVKIDNHVQIGHNACIGAHTAIAGCVGIAGSVIIGKRCMIGGATSISGHTEIVDDVIITGMSGVANSIKEAGTYSSAIPIMENKIWQKNVARFKHLDEIIRKFKKL